MVAPVKGMPRALVKLVEYSQDNLGKPPTELESRIMEVKDLARGSIICNTAEQTARVFANLTAANPDFKVYKFKNGFADTTKSNTD